MVDMVLLAFLPSEDALAWPGTLGLVGPLDNPRRFGQWILGVTTATCLIRQDSCLRTIVKPLWQLPPSESKKPFNTSRTKNVALKLPKISLTKGYFGQFKGKFGR